MKLKAQLPKGDSDGLSPLEGKLDASAGQGSVRVVALAILDVAFRTEDVVTHERELTLRIRRIEALLPADAEAGARLLQRAFEDRTGVLTIPIDLEDDIRSAFGMNVTVDVATGEVIFTDEATDEHTEGDS